MRNKDLGQHPDEEVAISGDLKAILEGAAGVPVLDVTVPFAKNVPGPIRMSAQFLAALAGMLGSMGRNRDANEAPPERPGGN